LVQVYALVGVAAVLAANCRVPLTSVLLLFELTRGAFSGLSTAMTLLAAHNIASQVPIWRRVTSRHAILFCADYYIIVPSLLSVGLSFWAVQYALRGLSFMASYTPDYLAGDVHTLLQVLTSIRVV
jgi:pimeloyl-ACP methyl ester carboxylesterase